MKTFFFIKPSFSLFSFLRSLYYNYLTPFISDCSRGVATCCTTYMHTLGGGTIKEDSPCPETKTLLLRSFCALPHRHSYKLHCHIWNLIKYETGFQLRSTWFYMLSVGSHYTFIWGSHLKSATGSFVDHSCSWRSIKLGKSEWVKANSACQPEDYKYDWMVR